MNGNYFNCTTLNGFLQEVRNCANRVFTPRLIFRKIKYVIIFLW